MSDQAKVTLTGTIHTIFPTESYGTFEKRVMWLEEQTDRYPQTYPIEFHKDDCTVLEAFKEGDTVECNINLRGRHWTKGDREGCISSLQCWRIKRIGEPAQQSGAQQKEPVTQYNPGYPANEAGDDLPF